MGQFERELEESLEESFGTSSTLAALRRIHGLEEMAEDAGRKLDAYEDSLRVLLKAVKEKSL